MRVRGSYDGVIAITSMVAVGVVLGFLGGAVADTGAVGLPIAAIAFVQPAQVFSHARRSRSSRPLAKPGP